MTTDAARSRVDIASTRRSAWVMSAASSAGVTTTPEPDPDEDADAASPAVAPCATAGVASPRTAMHAVIPRSRTVRRTGPVYVRVLTPSWEEGDAQAGRTGWRRMVRSLADSTLRKSLR